MRVQSRLCTQNGPQIHICGRGSLYTLRLAMHTAMKLRQAIFTRTYFRSQNSRQGNGFLALICVIGRDGYNEIDKGQSSICSRKVESRVTLSNVLRHVCLHNA
jgi:hypothetical protein